MSFQGSEPRLARSSGSSSRTASLSRTANAAKHGRCEANHRHLHRQRLRWSFEVKRPRAKNVQRRKTQVCSCLFMTEDTRLHVHKHCIVHVCPHRYISPHFLSKLLQRPKRPTSKRLRRPVWAKANQPTDTRAGHARDTRVTCSVFGSPRQRS